MFIYLYIHCYFANDRRKNIKPEVKKENKYCGYSGFLINEYLY